MPNMEYFKKHPAFNATIHFIGGIGIGCLLINPLFDGHTIRWGVALIIVAFLGHLYAWYTKK